MYKRVAWAILGLGIVLALAGFAFLFAALGWMGLGLGPLAGPFGIGSLLWALVGALFVLAGVVGVAVSMSIQMYSAPDQLEPEPDRVGREGKGDATPKA